MPIEKWNKVALRDFPRVEEVTRDMLEYAAVNAQLYPHCGVRFCMGKLMTTREIERERERSLRPLYDWDNN